MEANQSSKPITVDSMSTKETVDIDINQLIILPNDEKKLIFEEHLQLVDNERVLDEVTSSVDESDLAEDSLAVYQYSEISPCLVRVQSHVDRSLTTLSEVRKITVQERKTLLRITKSRKGFKVFKTCYEGREGTREKSFIPKPPTDTLFLEGCNIILLRKLAINRLLGQFRGLTLDHEGVLQECEYTVEGGPHGEVVVRRTVPGEVLITRLRSDGRILEHSWSSSQLRLVSFEPELTYEEATTTPGASTPVPEPRADTPAYFQKKEELIGKMEVYLRDHVDVQDMIADLIKDLLFEKPDDVVDFADQFFSDFLGITREQCMEPKKEYSNSNVSGDTN